MSLRAGREPALYLTLFATLVRFAGAFFVEVTGEQQAWLNAAATAIASAAVAVWVRRDGQVPAILGAVQAVLALAVGYGLDWSAEQQAIVMSLVGAAAAFYTRTQVVAPVPPAPVTAGARLD